MSKTPDKHDSHARGGDSKARSANVVPTDEQHKASGSAHFSHAQQPAQGGAQPQETMRDKRDSYSGGRSGND